MGYSERYQRYLSEQQQAEDTQIAREEEWNQSVLPKVALFNQLGIKDVLNDIRNGVWETGEIINFSTSKETFLKESPYTPHTISCSLLVRRPLASFAYTDYNKTGNSRIITDQYGIAVESKGNGTNGSYSLSVIAKLPCRTDPDYIQERMSFVTSPQDSIMVQNLIIDTWESYLQSPNKNIEYLKNFATRPAEPEVVRLVQRGCAVPEEFKYLEEYRTRKS